ncbi:MAG: hypothetical protein AMXMBFR45_01730 [Gammaproteobacteria bacterium]|nr:hypothetical protein [Gammaproteobacteria bacterium PRO2]GIK35879.1 MAG: hypothetical protein BroJett010_24380 [Gammaproteobacteria bacterium]
MPKVVFHTDSKTDLAAIRADDHRPAARILALMEQAKSDQELFDRLTQHDYGQAGTADFHVSRWESQQNNEMRNLWRLKLWELEELGIRYRVVYAFEPLTRTIAVLGIARRREFNYEDDAFTQRVIECYDRHFSRT